LPATHIALLRGINVGTAKRVPMADLRELFESLGYSNVATLLNSGNVVFAGRRETPAQAEARIEKAIVGRFGFPSRTTVITADELAVIVAENCLTSMATDPSRLMIAIMKSAAERARIEHLTSQDWKPDALALGARVAYMWCPAGALDSPLSIAANKALGDAVTVRNWSTIQKLHALAAR
jgi:uncharacterized protein (DUF1697 family)